MDISERKFVEFEKYCKDCKFKDLEETEEPCCDCLAEPVNLYSHKPVKWKEGNLKGE